MQIKPKHTFGSVVEELANGLKSGTITIPESESVGTTSGESPHQVFISYSLDSRERQAQAESRTVESVLEEYSTRLRQSTYPGEKCFLPDEVAEYVHGILPEERLSHAEGCAACATLLAASVPVEDAANALVAEAKSSTAADGFASGNLPEPLTAIPTQHEPARFVTLLRTWAGELLSLTLLLTGTYLTYLGNRRIPTLSFWLGPKSWGLALLASAMMLIVLEFCGRRSFTQRSLAAGVAFAVVLVSFFFRGFWRDPSSWVLAFLAAVLALTLLQLFGRRSLAWRTVGAGIAFAAVLATFSFADFRRSDAVLALKSIQLRLGALSLYSIHNHRSKDKFLDAQQQSDVFRVETLERSSTLVSYLESSTELPAGTWELHLGADGGTLRYGYRNRVAWEGQLFTGTMQDSNERFTMLLPDGKTYHLSLAGLPGLAPRTELLAMVDPTTASVRSVFALTPDAILISERFTMLLPDRKTYDLGLAGLPGLALGTHVLDMVDLELSSDGILVSDASGDLKSNQASRVGQPEPSSLILFGCGILGLGGLVRRRLMT